MGLFLVPDYPILAATEGRCCQNAGRSVCRNLLLLYCFLSQAPANSSVQYLYSIIEYTYTVFFFIVAYFLDCLVLKDNLFQCSVVTSHVSFARTEKRKNTRFHSSAFLHNDTFTLSGATKGCYPSRKQFRTCTSLYNSCL